MHNGLSTEAEGLLTKVQATGGVMKQVIGGVSVRVDRSVGYGLTMCMKPLTLSIQSSKSLSSGSGSSSG